MLYVCNPVKMLQKGVPNTARISPVREGTAIEFVPLNYFPLYLQGTARKEQLCLAQAKDGAVFGIPSCSELPILLFRKGNC